MWLSYICGLIGILKVCFSKVLLLKFGHATLCHCDYKIIEKGQNQPYKGGYTTITSSECVQCDNVKHEEVLFPHVLHRVSKKNAMKFNRLSCILHCKNRLVEMTNLNWLSQTHLFNQFLFVKTTNK